MSANARRRAHPDAHQAERRIAENPARAWDGCVRVCTSQGVLEIPGTWHLDMPGLGRPLLHRPRATLPLPPYDDLEAWREHLVRLVTLQAPGMQLRVRSADAEGWQSLEFAAPTVPASVVQVDRQGVAALLGPNANVALSIRTGS